jgi:hypothetical protein
MYHPVQKNPFPLFKNPDSGPTPKGNPGSQPLFILDPAIEPSYPKAPKGLPANAV